MEQKDKELLLKDLCARLPYGVIVNVRNLINRQLTSINYFEEIGVNDCSTCLHPISEIKPYLFPISSMTEKQKHKFLCTCNAYCDYYWTEETFDWLNRNHFDYRGLIEKGLAVNATGLNIY